jgi:signal transduction histidine kinase
MAETTGDSIVYADRDRLVAVIDHIIQNAQEATPATGGVSVRLIEKDQQASIEISDDGVGMEAAFIRERLFRPFDSTKGLSGMGIGAYECREFVQSLGGRVEVSSSPGKGTRFVIILPTEDSVGECRSFGTVLG